MDVDAAPALKRKDAPELWVDDDVGPWFPVASRATKIRRLDPEMMPVVPSAVVPPQPPPGTQPPVAGFGVVEEAPMCGDVAVVPVDVAEVPANEERAIVLYRPAEAERRLLLGPLRPGGHLRVNPDWIQALNLNGTMLQEASNHRALFEGLAGAESSNLAMIPWAPSRAQAASTAAEMMEAEDGEGASMEVEQDRTEQQLSMPQWPQQQQPPHCMVQQQPIPVAWSL